MNRFIHLICAAICMFSGLSQGQNSETAIKSGDKVGISISGIPAEDVVSIKNTYTVSGRGTINLLYIDEVKASGLTPSELERSIESIYKSRQIYTRPTVTVSMDGGQIGDRVVFVNGEAAKPGPVPFRSGMTASRALATAGGPTPYAKLSKAKLLRNGKVVAVLDLAKADKPDGQTLMEPDDELVIPD